MLKLQTPSSQAEFMPSPLTIARTSYETALQITVTNPNASTFPPIVFKVLTNARYEYCVRPNMGVLKSGEKMDVKRAYLFGL